MSVVETSFEEKGHDFIVLICLKCPRDGGEMTNPKNQKSDAGS